MSVIKIMDELLANKIAAGEVVERCASVVKELVENSIDANATEIKVELIDSGTKEIKVTDNGKGMDKEDAVMAFARHATSKIQEEEDLYHIHTLGFRGEALASIASVSNITLQTSMGDVGTFVHIQGGKFVEITHSDARRGTCIIVKDLFYNTPARLKHMKSLYTELASITEYMNKLALTSPNIRFFVTNNGTTLLNTDAADNPLKTIRNIYGVEIAKKMIPVQATNDDYIVKGYISLPEVHRSNRNNMITIVNGRVVRNTELNKTINDSYHSYKPDTRYPIVVLTIEVDPLLIDVNIHPTKMDIKFSKIEELQSLLSNMIKQVLSKTTLIPNAIEEKEIEPKEPPKKTIQPVSYEEITFELERTSEEEPTLMVNNDLTTETLFKETDTKVSVETQKDRLPELYPVGLVHGTYIVCQNEQGMYLIDQHAAKERVNYEMYKEKLGHPIENTIALLFPITIELSNSDFIILKENLSIMKNMYFDIEEFGVSSIIIKSHPTWLPKGREEEAIRKMIEVILHCEKNFSIEKFNEKIAIMLSCKMAIKANQNITIEDMEALLDELRNCENPFNCPHGRPTIIFYSNYDLEKLFKRSGF